MCRGAASSRSSNGATTLNIPDTVGYGVPEEFARADPPRHRATVTGDYVVSTHCHNDLGLAVANSLAGVAAGARQVECAINGLGERAGNAALEEIVMAMRTRSDYFDAARHRREHRGAGPHVAAGRRASPATRSSTTRRSSAATRSRTRPGIHQHGVLEDRETYEIIDAVDRRPGGRADRAGQALRPPRVRRHAGEDGPARAGRRAEPGVHPVQGAGRPQGARSPRPTSRRSWPRSSASARCTGSRSSSLEVRGGTHAMPTAQRRAAPTATARSRPTARATA